MRCLQAVELGAASKAFDVQLPQLGPYKVSFSRSGRWLAMSGEKGHLALTDWSRMYTACEVQVRCAARCKHISRCMKLFCAYKHRCSVVASLFCKRLPPVQRCLATRVRLELYNRIC